VPNCQGNDPAAWALRKGLPAGVSLIEMAKQLGKGGIYVQREVSSDFPMKGQVLHQKLLEESVQLFKDSWLSIYDSEIIPRPQTGKITYHTRKQTNADRVQDASKRMSLYEFINWALAHDFSPRTTAEVEFRGRAYKLSLEIEEKSDKD